MKKGNAPKTVLLLLAAALLVQYASLTKLKKVWDLAFNASPLPAGGNNPTPASQGCSSSQFQFNNWCYAIGTPSFPAGPHQSCPAGYTYNAGFCILNQ